MMKLSEPPDAPAKRTVAEVRYPNNSTQSHVHGPEYEVMRHGHLAVLDSFPTGGWGMKPWLTDTSNPTAKTQLKNYTDTVN